MALIYITGGAKSGKSKFAEEIINKLNEETNQKLEYNERLPKIYIATSQVFDKEMEEKVRLHKERRKNEWITIETYKDFENEFYKKLNKNKIKEYNILLDCLTNLISSTIFNNEYNIDFDNLTENDKEKFDVEVRKNVEELVEISKKVKNIIVVSNELGMGIVPSYPLGRYFREINGKMNQYIAENADKVYFVVSGIPMKIKEKL